MRKNVFKEALWPTRAEVLHGQCRLACQGHVRVRLFTAQSRKPGTFGVKWVTPKPHCRRQAKNGPLGKEEVPSPGTGGIRIPECLDAPFGPAIAWRVAPQQSPPPFHRTLRRYTDSDSYSNRPYVPKSHAVESLPSPHPQAPRRTRVMAQKTRWGLSVRLERFSISSSFQGVAKGSV